MTLVSDQVGNQNVGDAAHMHKRRLSIRHLSVLLSFYHLNVLVGVPIFLFNGLGTVYMDRGYFKLSASTLIG